jgi:hypothetical protein
LFGEAAKWLAEETRSPRRQSLVRLAKYVSRAAAKTSPFSTFMFTGAGSWSEHRPDPSSITPIEVGRVLEMNGFLLQCLLGALRDDPRLSARLRLRANPTATIHDGMVRFLGAPPGEAIVRVPATATVLDCLRLLHSANTYTLAELVDLLNEGDSDDVAVERFLTTLVGAGLLERQLPVADQAADPLRELADWLAAGTGRDFSDTVTQMTMVRSQLRGPAPLSDAGEEDRRQRALVRALVDLAERAGVPPEIPVRMGKTIVYESAVFTDPVVELPMRRWRPALQDLDVVRRALAVIDAALPLRVALGAYCAQRFGAGSAVPFVLLHGEIVADLSRDAADQTPAARELARFLRLAASLSTYSASLHDSPLTRLRELDRMQRELRQVMLSPAPADRVVRVDPDTLARLSTTWPAWVTTPPSVAWYLQAVDDEQSLRLVVNTLHAGYGRNRSRALHLSSQAGGTDRWDRRRNGANGPLLAELGGLFGYSLNVRLESLPFEIDYPFTVSARTAEQRIPISDLEVVHDVRTGLSRLVATGLKHEVKAFHLGMMAGSLLPPAARLLTRAFGSASLSGASVRRLTSEFGVMSVPDAVTSVPRVEVGRVIVRRAYWRVPVDQVPKRGKGGADADCLLRMVAWLRSHGIPTRCFVRTLAKEVFGLESTASIALDKSHKPMYVDFANLYLLLAFERMLNDCGPVVIFEEALPNPSDPALAASSVTEYVVEVSEPVAGDA